MNDEIIHLIDEMETMRGSFLRTLRSEVSMLQDALDALRKNKTHVTEDHIERVLDRLNAQVEKLQQRR